MSEKDIKSGCLWKRLDGKEKRSITTIGLFYILKFFPKALRINSHMTVIQSEDVKIQDYIIAIYRSYKAHKGFCDSIPFGYVLFGLIKPKD